MQTWKSEHPRLTILLFYAATTLFLLFGVIYTLVTGYTALSLFGQPIPSLIEALNIPLFLPCALSFIAAVLLRPIHRRNSRGSAHWATITELRQARLIQARRQSSRQNLLPLPRGQQRPQKLLPAPGGNQQIPVESRFVVGCLRGYDITLAERKQESHLLIVAPTGKRKTSGFFIPALLREQGHRSLLINDVKDELYQLCSGAMSRYHDILLFSPTRANRSNTYNPLAHIRSSKDARDFATAWVANTGLSREEFYNTTSRTLITALVLHVIDTEPHAPLSRLADLVSTKTLDDMKELLLNSHSQRARNTAGAFMQVAESNPTLASGVMLGISNRFSILIDSPEYRQVTASDDLDFARMIDGTQPVALFINVPASATDDVKPLTSSLIMQLMNYLTRRAEQEPGGRLPRPCALYLDEFANAGRIPDIEKHITLVRGAGIAVIAALQDFGQLERVYDRQIADTLLSNCTTQIMLPGLGQREANYYSHRLGFATVLSTSRSTSGTPFSGQRSTISTSETQRALMLPDEIRTMAIGTVLMISDNIPPIHAEFRTYLEQPDLVQLTKLPTPTRVILAAAPTLRQPSPESIKAFPPPDLLL